MSVVPAEAGTHTEQPESQCEQSGSVTFSMDPRLRGGDGQVGNDDAS